MRLLLVSSAIGFQDTVLYGDISQYGYYFVDLLVGTPPQVVSAIVDTGSTLISFPCEPCVQCGEHIDPFFEVAQSETAEWVKCTDCATLGTCSDSKCTYARSYLEGSSLSGAWFRDVLALSPADSDVRSPSNFPVRRNATAKHTSLLGCHTRETRLFATQKADGIFGFGPPTMNMPNSAAHDILIASETHNSPAVTGTVARGNGDVSLTSGSLRIGEKNSTIRDVDTKTASQEGAEKTLPPQSITENTFALCFALHGGYMQFGGYNSTVHTGAIGWTPLRIATRYEVEVTGVKMLDWFVQAQYIAVVDSGSTLTYFPERVYGDVSDIIANHLGLPGPCWPKHIVLSNFPLINITLGRFLTVTWHPEEYLHLAVTNTSTTKPHPYTKRTAGSDLLTERCLAFRPSKTKFVMGASFMQRKNVVFDLANEQLGIAPANCPERYVRDRPAVVASTQSTVWLVSIVLIGMIATALPTVCKPSQRTIDQEQQVRLRTPLHRIEEEYS